VVGEIDELLYGCEHLHRDPKEGRAFVVVIEPVRNVRIEHPPVALAFVAARERIAAW